MRSMDLSPFRRSSVGFDRMLDMLDDDRRYDTPGYPPYNILQTRENAFLITIAIPGYKPDDIEIIFHQNVLTIRAQPRLTDQQDFLHRGIQSDGFEQHFNLADFIQVKNAGLEMAFWKLN